MDLYYASANILNVKLTRSNYGYVYTSIDTFKYDRLRVYRCISLLLLSNFGNKSYDYKNLVCNLVKVLSSLKSLYFKRYSAIHDTGVYACSNVKNSNSCRRVYIRCARVKNR